MFIIERKGQFVTKSSSTSDNVPPFVSYKKQTR